jgi:hypothetical protein
LLQIALKGGRLLDASVRLRTSASGCGRRVSNCFGGLENDGERLM